MPVLTFVEISGGKIKKASVEAAYYGSKTAEALGTESLAVVLGEASGDELATLGQVGIKKVLHAADARLNNFDSGVYTKVVAAAAEATQADVVALSFNHNGKLLAPRLSVRLKAGYVPGAVELPQFNGSTMTVRKNVFSGKATAIYQVTTPRKIVSVNPNSLSPVRGSGSATVEAFTPAISDADFRVTVKGVDKVVGEIPLTEAEIVISGGRGLKGPENWYLITDLAKEMGAATACSRAVADVDWRPHHEHVGQTGLTIRPNLYVAVGISGAIQHLAGVNGSKVIVVINTDPEAPFFKAADYGIVGDAFEVMPKLLEEYRKFKAAH
ncbi:MAG: electron transfer flavoprotein subunit alpha/FixB family protein [Chitinophagales bacterium]|nr:electron transfer flavoprotein subunit alpha/FixB family protein [Chitinophagales bacterium]MDW8418933.1 electron transfer flavoprotein subunit alpha/FixB family protein [Chitinophagales bacterium]